MSSRLRCRFAPSPTGYLHVGGARTVLFNWLFARRNDAEFLLRIEDTDTERNRPELTEDILASIEWLGLGWDGEAVHQSDNRSRHLAVADTLFETGHAFWSGWQRRDTAGGPPQRRADDRDAGLGPGEGRALRFRVPDEGETTVADLVRGHIALANADIEDFVLVRSNGEPSFYLANAVDDADMGITHVLRGEEHLTATTPKTLLIQSAMGVPTPEAFAHLSILVDEHRKKLSKRKHSVAVADFRAGGILPEAMVNYLALLGWGPPDGVEVRPLAELVELFRLEDVTPSPAFFDTRKLESINGEYIRSRIELDDFVRRAEPFLPDPDPRKAFEALAPLAKERLRRLDEVESLFDWTSGPVDTPGAWEKAMKLPVAAEALDRIIARYESVEWSRDVLYGQFTAVAADLEIAARKLDGPLRVAVTGRVQGLPLFDIFEYLGRDETLRRLREARAKL